VKRREFLRTTAAAAAASGGLALGGTCVAAQHAPHAKIKITKVEPILIKATRGYKEWNLVRLHTDQGLTGIGEGFAWGGKARTIAGHIKQLGQSLVDTSPLRIEAFLHRASADPPEDKLAWFAAVSAIEIALWDIAGQVAGLPIYAMLGGKMRERIPLYADHGVFKHGFDVQRIVAMKEAGYGMFKWDPFQGGGNPGKEAIAAQVQQVAQVRRAVGPDYPLAIDAHGRFDLEGAKLAAKALEPLNVLFFEEPIHYTKPELFAPLAKSTSLTLATGEMLTTRIQLKTFLETAAVGVFQPEVGTNGGILESVKAAAMCEPYGVKIAAHNWCGPVVTRAATHVCATIPNLLYQEYASVAPEDQWELDLLDPPTQLDHGHIIPPEGPGLGSKLNEKLLKERRIS